MSDVSSRVCAGLGPLAAGWLYDVLHHYELAFWLCAGAFLLAATVLAFVPQPEHVRQLADGAQSAHVLRPMAEKAMKD